MESINEKLLEEMSMSSDKLINESIKLGHLKKNIFGKVEMTSEGAGFFGSIIALKRGLKELAQLIPVLMILADKLNTKQRIEFVDEVVKILKAKKYMDDDGHNLLV